MTAADAVFLLERVPATFWGVVAGAVFTLCGVIISNRSSNSRLTRQLDNDRDIKYRELDLTLRKDVYLAAAEAVAVGINTIGKFSDIKDINNDFMAIFLEKAPAIAKVQVIAKTDTALAVAKLSHELNLAFTRLLIKRVPLVAESQAIEGFSKLHDTSAAERQRMVDLMTQHNLDRVGDQEKFSALQNNYKFEAERAEKMLAEIGVRRYALYVKQLELMTLCVAEAGKISRLVVPALAAIRAELELPTEIDVLKALVEDAINSTEAITAEAKQYLQSFVATAFIPPSAEQQK